MKKRERIVNFFDLTIGAASRRFSEPESISVRRAFELMGLVPVSQRTKAFSKGQEVLYIADWKVINGYLMLLVNKSDQSIADPVFTIPKRQSRRTASKAQNEGQDFSVHIAVKLPPKGKDLDPATVAIEVCPGLSLTLVARLFNHLLNFAKKYSPADFEQAHPDGSIDEDGNPKKIDVRFVCNFQGHPSAELVDDLNHGTVQSVELIDERTQYKKFDQLGYITEKCRKVVLVLRDENHKVLDRFKRISDVVMSRKKEYSHARISFRTPKGISRNIDMSVANGLAAAYVKRAKIDGFSYDLKSSYDQISDEIGKKMRDLF